jgi:hypothetical protein
MISLRYIEKILKNVFTMETGAYTIHYSNAILLHKIMNEQILPTGSSFRCSGAAVTQLKHFLQSHQLPLDNQRLHDTSINHHGRIARNSNKENEANTYINSIEFALALRRHSIEIYV